MGVIQKNDLGESCKLWIWEIKEEYDDLRSRVSLESEEVKTLDGFRNHNRKLEWLSVRTLINEMTGTKSRIIYNEDRKPFLLDNSSHISIAHSRNYTSILLSRYKRVGIDLEYMSHRISRIANRFINENEKIISSPGLERYHLYIHWCAKEALYKICDKKNINFLKNLSIEPFMPENEGIIKGTVDNINGLDIYDLYYRRMKDYVMVWTCK